MSLQLNTQQLKIVQQHVLLQQMHIDIWVNRDSNVTKVAPLLKQIEDVNARKMSAVVVNKENPNTPVKETLVKETLVKEELDVAFTNTANTDSTTNEIISHINTTDTIAHNPITNNAVINNPVINNNETATTNKSVESNNTTAGNTVHELPNKRLHDSHNNPQTKSQNDITDEQISSFSLKGFYANNWVVIVDVAHLTDEQQTLWDSLTSALKVSVDTFNFPSVYVHKTDIDNKQTNTVDMANINFSGFMNRLALFKQDISIACLTKLTDGLVDSRIKDVPSLAQMLTDANKKRELWQLLNDKP